MACSEEEKKRIRRQTERHKREMEARTRNSPPCFSQICFGEVNRKKTDKTSAQGEDCRFPDPKNFFERPKKPPFCGSDCPLIGGNSKKTGGVDSDAAMLLPLMLLLMGEKADFGLIMALMYIMM